MYTVLGFGLGLNTMACVPQGLVTRPGFCTCTVKGSMLWTEGLQGVATWLQAAHYIQCIVRLKGVDIAENT